MADWLKTITEGAHEGLKRQQVFDYLQSRGVSEADAHEHCIGFAHPSVLKIELATKEFHYWSNTFLWDHFVFPIYSPTGDTIGVQTKALDLKVTPRYQQFYCYPTALFPYLFGLKQALPSIYKTNQIIVVEGVFDYFAVRATGARNVVAQLTAGVPKAAKRFYKRFAKRITFLLDMDQTGRDAAYSMVQEWVDGGNMIYVPNYSEKDPGQMFLNGKLPELAKCISSSVQPL